MPESSPFVGYGKDGTPDRSAWRPSTASKSSRGWTWIGTESLDGADVAVEFSMPAAVLGNIRKAAALGIPIVVGTTGWLEHLDEVKALDRSHKSALVWSPNFSVGVNVFTRLVSEAARLLAERERIWRVGLGDPSQHQERRAFRHAAQAGGPDEGAGYARNIDASSSRAGAHPGTHEIGFDSRRRHHHLAPHRAQPRRFRPGRFESGTMDYRAQRLYEFSDVLVWRLTCCSQVAAPRWSRRSARTVLWMSPLFARW